MSGSGRLGLRWTIGDVSGRGFEALRLSLWGAWRVFGPDAAYAVCVNTVPLAEARARTGAVPEAVVWHCVTGEAGRTGTAGAVGDDLPEILGRFLDGGMAEGTAWKFAPLRLFPDRHELALDNDCILWAMPRAVAGWLAAGDAAPCLLAEDVRPCFGQFAGLCGPRPLNLGIRGLPPGFDLGAALRAVLERHPALLTSELDEQGLQVAALSQAGAVLAVGLDEVTICSPFPPHLPHLGRCGAHFVGQNVKHVPWSHYDRPGIDCLAEHWERHRPALYRAVGLELPPA